jgi:hypothetical protein
LKLDEKLKDMPWTERPTDALEGAGSHWPSKSKLLKSQIILYKIISSLTSMLSKTTNSLRVFKNLSGTRCSLISLQIPEDQKPAF